LNIPREFGIIQTAIEMAGISRRTASRKLQRSKDIGQAAQVLVSADTQKSIILHHKSYAFKHFGVLMTKNLCNMWLKICEICVLSFQPRKRTSTKDYVRKNNLFMQNEPNFQKVKLNVNKVLTKDYEQLDTWSIGKNEPKTNPNEPNQSQFAKC
jgi:hypothetical protein